MRLALLIAMLNHEGVGGLEINDDSLKNNPVSLWNLVYSSNVGLTEISILTLTLTLNLTLTLIGACAPLRQTYSP